MQVTLAFLIVFVATGGAANEPLQFTLIVPEGPVSARLGSSVTLPCAVSPPFSVVPLKMRWHRPEQFKTPVLLYENKRILKDPAGTGYRGRVSLVGNLEQGNVSIKLENIKLADKGLYVCFVQSKVWFEDANVTLNVEAIGTSPLLSLSQGDNGQVRVSCTSDGWSPQPVLTWTSGGGETINAVNTVYTTDNQSLVSVSSWLLHPPSQNESVSCSVGLSDQERREGRVVPFIYTSDKGAVIGGIIGGVVFLILVILIPTAVFLYRKGSQGKKGKKEAVALNKDALTVQKPIENTPTRLKQNEGSQGKKGKKEAVASTKDALTVQKPIEKTPTRLKQNEGSQGKKGKKREVTTVEEEKKLMKGKDVEEGETSRRDEKDDALTVQKHIEAITTRITTRLTDNKGVLRKLKNKIEDALKLQMGQTREDREPLNKLKMECARLNMENEKQTKDIEELKKKMDKVKKNMDQKPEDIEEMALVQKKLDEINNSISDLEKQVEELRFQVAEKTKGLNKGKGDSGYVNSL